MKSPKIDPIVEAERGVLAATVAVETLAAELRKAEGEAAKVAALFLRDATQLEANMKATMLADRARALHLEGQAKLDAARAHLAALQRAKLREQHEIDEAQLGTWIDQLDHGPLIAVGARLDEVVLGYCRSVIAAQEAWDEASARATELGVRFDIPKPSLEDAQYAAQKAARLAREASGVDAVGDWISPEPGAGDWRMNGASPAEVRKALDPKEKANRDEQTHAYLASKAASQQVNEKESSQ